MERVILPDAAWRHRPGLDRLVAALEVARFVGGSVRDTLLGIAVSDIDIATPLPPEEVLARLKEAGIKCVPTGLKHGTITAVLADGPVEVTTLRRDVDTDGRHATVAFTDDWQEDAARRDFTMNALYADPASGEVFDYFEGIADLRQARVRFIGDPYQRIAEDHLRILRFFRFLARFGDAPEPSGLKACADRANDLMALSRERIADELLKLLVARAAVQTVKLMLDTGIFAPVLPEIGGAGVERLAQLAAYETGFASATGSDPIRRLAALLPPDPAVADAVGARLKLSNVQRRRLLAATDRSPFESAQALAYQIGKEQAIDRILLTFPPGEAQARYASLADWDVPRCPLTGGAIVARGIKAGPEVARLMGVVQDHWVAEGFPDAARVEAIADAVVAEALKQG
jgi:poly(A) polymerase